MRKLILVAHISLDGFVAGLKGEIEGFDAAEENLQFVCGLTEDADAALFGRITYQWLEGAWPTAGRKPNATKGEIAYSNWYNKAQKIVFSRTLGRESLKNTIIVRGDIWNEVTKIKSQSGKNILIFGSPTVSQELMRLHLIDSCWIFVNPVFFGKGIPLFTELKEKRKLKPLTTHIFHNGEIAVNYTIDNE